MTVSIIVAMTQSRVIGKNGKLPWHIPADFQWFRRHTLNHPVVMGRKTFESIGQTLPQRENIILTRQRGYKVAQAIVLHSFEDALSHLKKTGKSEVFVIGGKEVFEKAIPVVHKLYLTVIRRDFDGDVFFPLYPEEQFEIIFREEHEGTIPFTFLILTRT